MFKVNTRSRLAVKALVNYTEHLFFSIFQVLPFVLKPEGFNNANKAMFWVSPLYCVLDYDGFSHAPGISPFQQYAFIRWTVYLKVKVEISIGIKELWVEAVNESNCFLDLTFQNHFPDLYPVIQRIQIHVRFNPRLHTKLLCRFFKALCEAKTYSLEQFCVRSALSYSWYI